MLSQYAHTQQLIFVFDILHSWAQATIVYKDATFWISFDFLHHLAAAVQKPSESSTKQRELIACTHNCRLEEGARVRERKNQKELEKKAKKKHPLVLYAVLA